MIRCQDANLALHRLTNVCCKNTIEVFRFSKQASDIIAKAERTLEISYGHMRNMRLDLTALLRHPVLLNGYLDIINPQRRILMS